MRLRFFAADRRGRLRKVRPRHVDGLINGRVPAAVLGCRGAHPCRC